MLAAEVRYWDLLARRVFIYTPDGNIDEWRSHADEALRGETIRDDCDGLASTVVDLCFRAGCPEDMLNRLAVKASSDGSGHMVAGIETEDAGFIIAGDTFRAPYPAAEIRHKPIMYRKLSEPVWRDGFPFTILSAPQ